MAITFLFTLFIILTILVVGILKLSRHFAYGIEQFDEVCRLKYGAEFEVYLEPMHATDIAPQYCADDNMSIKKIDMSDVRERCTKPNFFDWRSWEAKCV